MGADAKDVKRLRDETGAGFIDCKKALEEAGGDFAKAKELIRRKGLTRAERMSSRATKEGRIGCYVHTTGKLASMVELTCETDFVAKTPDFEKLLHQLCIQVVGASPEVVSKEHLPAELVETERKRLGEEIKGKPPEILEKIVAGKLEKGLFSQRCLLNQPFVNQEEFAGTVEELVKATIGKLGENITVRRFARFELGQ
jgi:elongation factor Ts